MAHELNELAPGIHSFASSRQHAWHHLGTVVDGDMTAEQALAAGHLAGWNVRKVALTATSLDADGVTTLDVPDRFATVYTNPVTGKVQYLGVVGTHYTPFQNEESADLLDEFTGTSGAAYETVGSIRGGRETFVSMRLPDGILVGGVDPVDLYLVAANSHDGSGSWRGMVTPVRPVCANTLTAATRSARSTFTIRHTAGSRRGAVVEARRVLGLTFAYVEEFQAEADRLIEQAYTDAEFARLTADVFGLSQAANQRQQTIALAHVNTVRDLWATDPFGTLGATKGTRWGAYQAVTEYTDHLMPVRGADAGAGRALRTATSATLQTIKDNAFKALVAA